MSEVAVGDIGFGQACHERTVMSHIKSMPASSPTRVRPLMHRRRERIEVTYAVCYHVVVARAMGNMSVNPSLRQRQPSLHDMPHFHTRPRKAKPLSSEKARSRRPMTMAA